MNEKELKENYYHKRFVQDKKQSLLTINGCMPNPFENATIPIKEELQGKTLFCPFCLTSTKFENFKLVKGELLECQMCKNRMRGKTLLFLTTVKMSDFALWVYNYRLSGFWQKVYPDFKQWFKKLKLLGLFEEFNQNYQRLKGENQNES